MESQLLRSTFVGLKPEQINQIGKLVIRRKYKRGEYIFYQGELWPNLLLIESGELSAVKESAEGRSLVLGKFTAGDIFWGMSFFNPDLETPVTLLASAPAEIMTWPRDSLLPYLLNHGEVGWSLCNLLIRRMHKASMMIEGLAFQPVACRLARLLLDHFNETPDGCLARDLTLDEMAARIGSTREMVCRILYRMADENLIQVTRTEFLLSDADGLTRLADR